MRSNVNRRNVWMARALGAVFLICATLPVGAQTPGLTKVTVRNPNPEKWETHGAFPSNRTFVCRPLACAAPSRVKVYFSRSPTRSPNKKALADFARTTVPELIEGTNAQFANSLTPGRKYERMSSGVTTVRGYPAVVTELRLISGQRVTYVSGAMVHAKSLVVHILSQSTSRSEARRNRDLFTRAMVVEDTPPSR